MYKVYNMEHERVQAAEFSSVLPLGYKHSPGRCIGYIPQQSRAEKNWAVKKNVHWCLRDNWLFCSLFDKFVFIYLKSLKGKTNIHVYQMRPYTVIGRTFSYWIHVHLPMFAYKLKWSQWGWTSWGSTCAHHFIWHVEEGKIHVRKVSQSFHYSHTSTSR